MELKVWLISSDDEVALGPRPEIASFSFGAERKFLFKHKQNGELVSMVLEHGSLLTMEGETHEILVAPITTVQENNNT